jgi:hypothetical protein
MSNPIANDDSATPEPAKVPLDYQGQSKAAGRIGAVRKYAVKWAWRSALGQVLFLGCFLLLGFTLPFLQGERTAAVWVYYYTFVALAAGGVCVAIASLFGIHSWRSALRILPAALFAIMLGAVMILGCMYICALTGKRW